MLRYHVCRFDYKDRRRCYEHSRLYECKACLHHTLIPREVHKNYTQKTVDPYTQHSNGHGSKPNAGVYKQCSNILSQYMALHYCMDYNVRTCGWERARVCARLKRRSVSRSPTQIPRKAVARHNRVSHTRSTSTYDHVVQCS